MRNYQPSFGFKETAENIRFFFEAHKGTFWAILRPLVPYIIGLYALDAVINGVLVAGKDETEFMFGSIIATYFYTALVISWYRVVILGPDHYVPMNPFRPSKDEVSYIMMSCLFGLVVLLGFGLAIGVAAVLPNAGYLAAFIVLFGLIFAFYRFSLYFPAKAAGGHMRLEESWALSRGMVGKMIFVPLLALLRVVLVFILYSLAIGVLIGLSVAISGGNVLIASLVQFVVSIPVLIFFYPLFMVFGASAMANYYLYAVQNRQQP